MKKITFLLFLLVTVGVTFQACDDTKSYAEQLEDEKKAINEYIKLNNIKAISEEDFLKDTITNVEMNEYVRFSNGVYLQIIDRGRDEKIKSGDEVLVRFVEYNIMEKYETGASNVDNPTYVDAFRFVDNTAYGQLEGRFIESWLSNFYYMAANTSIASAPKGWLFVLPYLKDRARVKLIVPSKMGHDYSERQVVPFFYDIRKFQIR